MSRKKLRDLTIVFWVGLFLLTREPVFLCLLAGSMILLHGEDSQGSSREKSIGKRMKADARECGVKLPKDKHLRQSLQRVYENYDQAIRDYPHLKQEYREIVLELWSSLSQKDLEDWSVAIYTVLAQWPNREVPSGNQVQKKISEVRELSKQWDEARKEAFGGSHV